MNTFYIFGSGEYGGAVPRVEDGAFIIAADGGLKELSRLRLTPGLIVGDFDSYSGAVPEGVETLRHPVMKDATDMELAIGEALRRGARDIVIYGGLGGRPDHTFANMQLLVMLARRGVRAVLAGPGMNVTALSSARLSFGPESRGLISVFAYGGSAVVTETGLLYGLHRHVLRDDGPMGVSNEFTGAPSRVTVHSGLCLVMWEDRAGTPPIWEELS